MRQNAVPLVFMWLLMCLTHWAALHGWFGIILGTGQGRPMLSSAFSVIGLMGLWAGISVLLSRVSQPSSITTFLCAGVVWTGTGAVFAFTFPHGPYFSFFEFGGTVISEGTLTPFGKKIELIQGLAKATAIAVGAILIVVQPNKRNTMNDNVD